MTDPKNNIDVEAAIQELMAEQNGEAQDEGQTDVDARANGPNVIVARPNNMVDRSWRAICCRCSTI